MSAQTADVPAPIGIKRSGSLSLLRGRTGSLRRKEGNRYNASKSSAGPSKTPARLAASTPEDPWGTGRTPEKLPAVSYAVTITAGNNPNDKPREKRRMLDRILHKRSNSRTERLPGITESDPAPESHRTSERAPSAPVRGHSRSTSALSFFRSDGTIGQDENEDDGAALKPWQDRNALPRVLYPTPPDSTKTSPMSKYNPNNGGTRHTAVSPGEKLHARWTEKPRPTTDAKAESTKSRRELPPSGSLALRPSQHPPRKSSLPDSSGPVELTVLALSSLDTTIARNTPTQKQHHSRPADRSPATAQEYGRPEPPPKDNVRKMIKQPRRLMLKQQGLDLTMTEPLDRFSVMFRDVLGIKGSPTSPHRNMAALPSPRLKAPLRSTLSTRRQAVPSMLQIMSTKSGSSKMHKVIEAVISPTGSQTEHSRLSSALLSSPITAKALSMTAAKVHRVEIAVTMRAPAPAPAPAPALPAPRRRAPLPPAGVQEPRQKPQEPSSTTSIPPQPKAAPPAPPIPQAAAAVASSSAMPPPPPVKSPRRRSQTYSGVYVTTSASGQRTLRKKSLHRRRPTGFRPVSSDVRRSRLPDANSGAAPVVPPAVPEQAIAQQHRDKGRRRSQSPHSSRLPAHLTPPQSQGEWSAESSASSRGKRQPSPLRNGTTTQDRKTTGSRTASGSTAKIDVGSRPQPQKSRSRSRDASTFEGRSGSSSRRSSRNGHRARIPSRAAMLPLAMHPTIGSSIGTLAAPVDSAAVLQAVAAASNPQTMAARRDVLIGAGHKVTAEESIKRMMDRQREQQETLRARLMRSAPHPERRPSEMTVETI